MKEKGKQIVKGSKPTNGTTEDKAIYVREAYKAFGRKKHRHIVLNGLNMTVQRNTIYGLLGSSGCGKTTLLKCLVGRTKLDSGELWVMGGPPGSRESGIPGRKVGYMPQETALIDAFTIRETLLYFGLISGMKTSEVDKKLDFLSEFLLLPPKKSLVKELSGGQQRRVSLSAALIHDPELLILDEPTVGVDPILRANIWEHLYDLTKHGDKTIIITTHYIEEMEQADFVGLMRGGYFIAEDDPKKLMKDMGIKNLEMIYLSLSIEQSKGWDNLNTTGTDKTQLPSISGANNNQKVKENVTKRKKCCIDMKCKLRHLSTLVWKNLLWMWRNKPTMAFTLLLPVIQMTGFILAIGHDPTNMEISIKNYEICKIKSGCPKTTGCTDKFLSCRYLKCLEEQKLIMKYFETEDEALTNVKKGYSYAAIVFRENFSTAFKNRIFQGRKTSLKDIENSEIAIHEDKSNMQITALLWKKFFEAFTTFSEKYLKECSLPVRLTKIPIRFNEPIYGASLPNYTDFVAPGAILTMSFFLAMALSAYGMIIERKEGSYERTAIQGVNDIEIIISHIIAQMSVIFLQCILLITISFLIFKLTNNGSLVTAFFLTILNAFSGLCYGNLLQGVDFFPIYFFGLFIGLLASAICKDEQTAAVLGIGSTVPTMVLSGMIWPIEAMHHYLQIAALFLPLTKSVASLRAICHRGWGINKPVVWQGFLFTFGWIVVFLFLCLVAIKCNRNK